jgi:hypothetical protein
MRVKSIVAAGLLVLGVAVGTGSAAAAAYPTGQYALCLPSNSCLGTASDASVRGTADWGYNTNTYRAVSQRYGAAQVTFTQYAGSVLVSRTVVPLPRGVVISGVQALGQSTDSLDVMLCTTAPVTPQCISTRVGRP